MPRLSRVWWQVSLWVFCAMSAGLPVHAIGEKDYSAGHVIVILGNELEIYSSPDGNRVGAIKSGDIELPIPVIQTLRGDWVKIRLPDRREVWIKRSNVRTRPPTGRPGPRAGTTKG